MKTNQLTVLIEWQSVYLSKGLLRRLHLVCNQRSFSLINWLIISIIHDFEALTEKQPMKLKGKMILIGISDQLISFHLKSSKKSKAFQI